MKNIVIGICIILFFFFFFVGVNELIGYLNKNHPNPAVVYGMEMGYAQGQMDALKGNYKIKYDSINKTWYWIGSPWDSGKPAIFNLNQLKK